jgi:XapX domain-containing protein
MGVDYAYTIVHKTAAAHIKAARDVGARAGVKRGGRVTHMLTYLISLGASVLVGIIYSLINVRSPAPPLVARAGLLGMHVGEEVIPVGKQIVGRKTPGRAPPMARVPGHSAIYGTAPRLAECALRAIPPYAASRAALFP